MVLAIIIGCLVLGGSITLAIVLPKFSAKKRVNMQIALINNELTAFANDLNRVNFVADKVLHLYRIHFAFDSTNRRLYLKSLEAPNGYILNYTDIINYEIIENGQTVYNSGTGSAVVGGLLFGVVGAVVGSTMHSTYEVCSIMQIRIIVNNIYTPSLVITLIAPPGVIRSDSYYMESLGFAREVIATLDVIKNQSLIGMR